MVKDGCKSIKSNNDDQEDHHDGSHCKDRVVFNIFAVLSNTVNCIFVKILQFI